MAATCTVTQETDINKLKRGQFTRVRWAWKSHTDGIVTAVGASEAISGRIHGARCYEITDASSAGSLPSSGYDVTLVDKYGFDVLAGLGANIPNSNANALTQILLTNSLAPVHAHSLSPGITNAGDTKLGWLDLIYEVI